MGYAFQIQVLYARRALYYSSLAEAKYDPNSAQPTPIPNDSLCLSGLCSGLVRVDLLSILVVADTGRRRSVSAALTGTDTTRKSALKFCFRLHVRPRFVSSAVLPNNLAVDGARDAVLQLEVHLGNGVFWEYRCIRNITCEEIYQHMVPQISSHIPRSDFCVHRPPISISWSRKGRDIRIAADSTMFLMVNLFIALSFGVHREQLEQRI